MIWQIRWTGPAIHDLEGLDRTTARRIRQAVQRYAETRYGDVISLRGREGEWRLWVGRWRILFIFDEANENILILHVLPRGSAYRR
jgi:mRNA-degrading endonuclease RelE of RelBE toxin-antitoxin system